MARLSADGNWLIQQIDGSVVVFHEHTEEEIVRFEPQFADEAAKAQKVIYDAPQLTDQEKCFAHFWSGYFYAHTSGD
jgi:hypothetical protein